MERKTRDWTPRGVSPGAVLEGPYRYSLTRKWIAGQGKTVFVMLNPSTASAMQDDPTIRRCIGFSQRLGHQELEVVNLFAWRTPSPDDLFRAHGDIVGPMNDEHILRAARSGNVVIAAWGPAGASRGRAAKVTQLLAGVRLYALGWTKDGHPRHPLYVPGLAPLLPFPPPGESSSSIA